MKHTIRHDSPLLLPNRSFWSRLGAVFRPIGEMDRLIHDGYHPYGPNKNPLSRTFKKSGPKVPQPKEFDENLEWVLICHEHKFIGLVTPKYYGDKTITAVVCPFCHEDAVLLVNLTDKYLTDTLLSPDKPLATKDKRVLHVTGAWRRLRSRFPRYTHRWTYVNGIPVRLDNDGRGTQLDD